MSRSEATPKNAQAPQPAGTKASECGAAHDGCPDAWKGCCDRPAGHEGSHHCSACNSSF